MVRERTVLVAGLDGSGKSSLLASLALSSESINGGWRGDRGGGAPVHTIPTVGYELVDIRRRNLRWKVWDVSGQGKFRDAWPIFGAQAQAIAFVVDPLDRKRLAVARDELRKLLSSATIRWRRLPVLVLVNKSDLSDAPGYLTCDEMSMALDLHAVQLSNPTRVVSTSSKNLSGIEDGIQWLNNQIR